MSIDILINKKRDRYFVIKKNNSIEEYFTFENACEQNDISIIVLDKFKEFFAPPGGFDWRISNFDFFIDASNKIKLNCNNWTVETIDITYKSASSIHFDIIISDPLKRIRTISDKLIEHRNCDYKSNDINIVLSTLKLLNGLSIYHNWEQIDLVAEIEKLKSENIELKKKLKVSKV